MKLLKPRYTPQETHQYIEDIKQVTVLRSHCKDQKEIDRYTSMIEVMQLTVIYMNEK